jgi:hypothetical protein
MSPRSYITDLLLAHRQGKEGDQLIGSVHRGVPVFIALSGLRVGEALDAMRLYRTQVLAIFIREIKKAYITVLDDTCSTCSRT